MSKWIVTRTWEVEAGRVHEAIVNAKPGEHFLTHAMAEEQEATGHSRPYTNVSEPGRIDESGQEWWACDPYPTWYRWDKNADGKNELSIKDDGIRWAW